MALEDRLRGWMGVLPDQGRQLIHGLYRTTLAFAVVGGGLLLAAFASLAVIGWAAATVGAVATWSLLLAALNGGLLLFAATLHRSMTGLWYWGQTAQPVFSVRGWLLLAIAAIGAVILVMVLDLE
jgi:hypothetical protein